MPILVKKSGAPMKREVTLYEILQVSPRASDLVIKAAYRCLAQANHPDKNAGNDIASERQAQINHAYAVLSNPVNRLRYDQAMDLHERFVERRGSGLATAGHSTGVAANHRVLRAFVFRPFTY
jgi:curved DNA-binding protein CbpA